MIFVRNVSRLKFGKARQALAIMKDGIAILSKVRPANCTAELGPKGERRKT